MTECSDVMHVVTEESFGSSRWCNCGKTQSRAWLWRQSRWRRLLIWFGLA